MTRPNPGGEVQVDAHGGYFVRLESFDGLDLIALARQALAGEALPPADVTLQVSVHRRRKVVHLTFGAPRFRGREGVRWFVEHHALAELLSRQVPGTVQAYAIDPDRFEEVFTWGNGRRVGGERLEYARVELPEEAETDDGAFERLTRHWPLGHLAYVFGLERKELLHLARVPALVLPLADGRGEERLASLLPPPSRQAVRAS